jgi:hypothetical protein
VSRHVSTGEEVVTATWWWETPGDGRRLDLSDPSVARAYLARLFAPPGDLVTARHLLSDGELSATRLGDGEVLDQLAQLIARGVLRLITTQHARLSRIAERAIEPAPEPAWDAPAPVEEVAAKAEESTFPPNIDAAAIAFILRQAAKSGVPFCEECLRKKLAEKAAEPGAMPEDLDSIAVAMVMRDAARTGTPFCEECMKARLKEAHAGDPS